MIMVACWKLTSFQHRTSQFEDEAETRVEAVTSEGCGVGAEIDGETDEDAAVIFLQSRTTRPKAWEQMALWAQVEGNGRSGTLGLWEFSLGAFVFLAV